MKKTSQEIAKDLRKANETKWARRRERWGKWQNERAAAQAEEMLLERNREER